MTSLKIQATKNYKMFHRHEGENRGIDHPKHRRLKESMQLYGFLKSFPVVCYKDKDGNLYVKDGQHRLAFAEELGLTVYWVVEEIDFDPAKVSSAGVAWVHKDWAIKYATKGMAVYQEVIDFADRFKVPVALAATLLAGTTGFKNVAAAFYEGTFKIKDRKWAEAVGSLYVRLIQLSKAIKGNHCQSACMALCRVPDFDGDRLVHGAEKCREKLVAYGTRDGYLDLFEHLYNFKRSKTMPLKFEATNAMRERNVVLKKKDAKNAKLQASAAQVTK